MQGIVLAQREAGMWFIVYQPVAFFVYFVAALAETNRAPFDMPEAESEIVAGYHTEFSGFRFALYFLAEYSNIVIVCSIAVTLFLGGWLRPFANVAAFDFLDYMPVAAMFGLGGLSFRSAPRQQRSMDKIAMAGIGGICILLGLALLGLPVVLDFVKNFFWFTAKVFLAVYTFIWIRFTFPRYRYDQLMSVGWRWLIPLSIANVIVTGIVIVLLQ
jgi:NADH-quinone oxidoreductase subunit H